MTDGSTTSTNYFLNLNRIDCRNHVEKKGKFSYLSWPWAVKVLRENHPDATWEVVKHPSERATIDENVAWLPYLKTELGYFVETSVTVEGMTLNHIHPMLDHQNKPIKTPNAFDVNTSIMRCLVKNIALHGIGLYIYAGEDLPPDAEGGSDNRPEYTQEQYDKFQALLKDGDPLAYVAFMNSLDVNTQTALYNSFEQGKKTEGKKKCDTLSSHGFDMVTQYVDTLNEAAGNNDHTQIQETVGELNDDAKRMIWKSLSPETQSAIREAMKEAA